jgi:hypothetical protein
VSAEAAAPLLSAVGAAPEDAPAAEDSKLAD